MNHSLLNFKSFSTSSFIVLFVAITFAASNQTFAQSSAADTAKGYIVQGRTELIVGGVLVVGGLYGTSKAIESFDPFADHVAAGVIVWPLVVVTGTIVTLSGVIHLSKGKKLSASLEKQYIPGLDHMGIVYPKYPTIGVKYRL